MNCDDQNKVNTAKKTTEKKKRKKRNTCTKLTKNRLGINNSEQLPQVVRSGQRCRRPRKAGFLPELLELQGQAPELELLELDRH